MFDIRNVLLFVRFAIVGGTSLAIILGCTYVLTDIAKIWYFFSFLIATGIGWTFIFFINALFTFNAADALTFRNYLVFIGGYAIVFSVNAAVVYVLTSLVGVFYEISILAGSAASLVLTFFFSKSVVFAKLPHDERSSVSPK